MNLFSEVFMTSFQRRVIKKCSLWAEQYRVMGEPFPGLWNTKHHPWIKYIMDWEDEEIVGQKGAQLAFTEAALNKTFFTIDIKGQSVLYLLPSLTPDAGDFSSSRFDPALELSKHLSDLFSDVKNVGHKRAGDANLFIRGSKSRSQLKSLPVSLIVFDEVDEMVQENIILAKERASGQVDKQFLYISTPTIPNHGINKMFQESTQDYFYFPCPSCSKLITLVYPESLVVTADSIHDPAIMNTHLICTACKNKLPHEGKIDYLANGQWVSSYTNRLVRGCTINQLYSMVVHPAALAKMAMQAETDPSIEQEFFNSKLGIPHTVKGAKVNDENITNCTSGFAKRRPTGDRLVTMGVDVGTWLHYEIAEWSLNEDEAASNDLNLIATPRIIEQNKVKDFRELDIIFHDYNVRYLVIDANPEHRSALELAQRLNGRVKLCYYNQGVAGKNIHVNIDAEHTIGVDRTNWLDLSLGRFKTKRIMLPIDLDMEYKDHIKAPVRVYKKDRYQNDVATYVKADKDEDHYAHARNYNEIALYMAMGVGLVQNIKDIM